MIDVNSIGTISYKFTRPTEAQSMPISPLAEPLYRLTTGEVGRRPQDVILGTAAT